MTAPGQIQLTVTQKIVVDWDYGVDWVTIWALTKSSNHPVSSARQLTIEATFPL
jgi:hypothetical protein